MSNGACSSIDPPCKQAEFRSKTETRPQSTCLRRHESTRHAYGTPRRQVVGLHGPLGAKHTSLDVVSRRKQRPARRGLAPKGGTVRKRVDRAVWTYRKRLPGFLSGQGSIKPLLASGKETVRGVPPNPCFVGGTSRPTTGRLPDHPWTTYGETNDRLRLQSGSDERQLFEAMGNRDR